MRRRLFSSALMLLAFVPGMVAAQELHQDFQERVSAEVVEIVDEYEREITGTGAVVEIQEVRVLIKEGGAGW